jgi:lysophospholipase L1-like esterase
MPQIGLAKQILFASLPLLLLLAAAETCVRVTRAGEVCPNRFSGTEVWTCDPILQFKLNPKLAVLGEQMSSDGFRTHELAPKRDGVFRILALGDSCTFGMLMRGRYFGYVRNPYPLALEKLLADRVGPGRFEVFNAGVPGYNSYQGLMLLRSKLRDFEPDLITVRFGWNDHFLSEAPPGKGPYRESDSRLVIALEDLALRTALYPFLRRLGFELRARRGESPDALRESFARQTQWVPTVTLADYEHNLRRIVEIGRARGAEVWLLTAPHNPAASEEASGFVSFNNKLPYAELIAIHEQYNEATRRVGRELGVRVIDMDAIYRDNPDVKLFVESDVLHPSQWGQHLEADVLYRSLAARGIAVPPAESSRRKRPRTSRRSGQSGPARSSAASRSWRAPARSPARSRAMPRRRNAAGSSGASRIASLKSAIAPAGSPGSRSRPRLV